MAASVGAGYSLALIVHDALPARQTQASTETLRAATIGALTASEAGRAARAELAAATHERDEYPATATARWNADSRATRLDRHG